MSSAVFRFVALCAVLSLVAGCGGSPGVSGGGTSATITYKFSGPAPTAVAVKIGSGGFTPATVTSGILTFTLPGGTTDFAVAYACPGFSLDLNSTLNLEFLKFSSSLDGTAYAAFCDTSPTSVPGGGTPPNGTLTGSVNSDSFPGANELFIWALTSASGHGEGFNLPLSNGFSMSSLSPGTDAVVLSLFDSSSNALAVKSFSNQAIPGALNNGSPVDFGVGDATTFQPITYVNVPAGYSVPSTSVSVRPEALSDPFLLQMNGDFGFYRGSQNPLTQYSMLPASIAQSGDRYQINSIASEQLSSATSDVSFSANLTGGGPATITFLTPWSYAGPTPAALPTVDFSYAGLAGQSGLSYEGSLQWVPASGINDEIEEIEIALTQNYQSASPSVAVPDLSTIPGFLAAPASGTTVSWSAEIGNGLFSGGSLISSAPLTSVRMTPSVTTSDSTTSSATTSTVTNYGTYTVP